MRGGLVRDDQAGQGGRGNPLKCLKNKGGAEPGPLWQVGSDEALLTFGPVGQL